MEILTNALGALWQVVVVGLVLGAGMPALFALGLRSLRSSRMGLAPVPSQDAALAKSSDPFGERLPPQMASPPQPAPQPPTTLGLVGAVVCFGVVLLAVAFGIVVIVFGKQLFG